MMSAVLEKQLMISVDNKVGSLAEVTSAISSAGLNLIATCAYAIDNKGFINFVTEDSNKALEVLEAKGFDVREEEAVLVSLGNNPGALQSLSAKIADAGIDMTLIYGSVSQGSKDSRLVLVSEDNSSVLALIRIMA